jgi:Domain of unknown function (DUF4917)
MKHFSTVVSLNYDLLVYWALMSGNSNSRNSFRDCFKYGKFQHDWERFRKSHNPSEKPTLVFYPHGNLALGIDCYGIEHKIHAERSNLLDTIIEGWQSDGVIPLFVSEGESAQKRKSIRRSPYFSTVFEEVLPQLGDSIVIYGWSMLHDDHILSAICKNRPKKFAVSALESSGQANKLRYEEIQSKLCNLLGNSKFKLCFFDANSAGCWNHPEITSSPTHVEGVKKRGRR